MNYDKVSFKTNGNRNVDLNQSDNQDNGAQKKSTSSKNKKIRISNKSIEILRNWFDKHNEEPYPSAEELILLSFQTGLKKKQVVNWFVNYRGRKWKTNQKSKRAFTRRIKNRLVEIGTHKDKSVTDEN